MICLVVSNSSTSSSSSWQMVSLLTWLTQGRPSSRPHIFQCPSSLSALGMLISVTCKCWMVVKGSCVQPEENLFSETLFNLCPSGTSKMWVHCLIQSNWKTNRQINKQKQANKDKLYLHEFLAAAEQSLPADGSLVSPHIYVYLL